MRYFFQVHLKNVNHLSSRLLVVSCAGSVLLAIAYLFYSNRLLAMIIGYFLHLNWWNEGSDRAWVSLGMACECFESQYVEHLLESFQVSLLAGRIMIKDLRYQSSDQTFRAIKCRITWRYWVWRTRGEFSGQIGEEESQGALGHWLFAAKTHN